MGLWLRAIAGVQGETVTDEAIHVRFTQDERTYRAFYRVDGQPWWAAPVTPYKGSNTLSPIVTLGAR